VPTDVIGALLIHDWPGNVRELSHTFARILLALAMGETPAVTTMLAKPREAIAGQGAEAADPHGAQELPAHGRKKLDELQEQDIFAALQNNDWTIRAAARELGISRPSVYKLLERYPHLRRAAAFQAALAPTESVGTKH
jgi:two-component system nitrogen regulation response regulator GlnG